jgi:hypothetical protein
MWSRVPRRGAGGGGGVEDLESLFCYIGLLVCRMWLSVLYLAIQDLEGLFCYKGLLGCRMCPRGALHGVKDLEAFSVMHQAGLALTSKAAKFYNLRSLGMGKRHYGI